MAGKRPAAAMSRPLIPLVRGGGGDDEVGRGIPSNIGWLIYTWWVYMCVPVCVLVCVCAYVFVPVPICEFQSESVTEYEMREYGYACVFVFFVYS